MHRAAAFESIHNPQNKNDFENAIHTMRYEEAFISQIAVLQSRKKSGENKAYTCENSELRKHFEESLPFELTEGQKTLLAK